MKKEFYHVYCKGILGVRTNVPNFRWVYGSDAPDMSAEQYEKCAVKFEIYVKPEKELAEPSACDGKFQAYSWDDSDKTVFYRRTLISNLKIGYNIKISGNTVSADIGKRYFNMIKNRTMNLHGVYYLLSDLANVLLLNNGLLTLYSSAIYFSLNNKGVVCFAPPNTGKTVTASKLCKSFHCSLVGEDVVITDGNQLFSCPWTNSYRKKDAVLDSAGALGRVKKLETKNVCESCHLTDLVVLSLGEKQISTDKDKIFRQINILNGYLFQHYASPLIKILAYFDEAYCKPWSKKAEKMLKEMVDKCQCYLIQTEVPLDFAEIIHVRNLGKE